MPKGGAEKLGKQISSDRASGNQRYEELKGQLQPQYNQFWQNYKGAVDRQTKDYGNFMGRYNEFADTGGFSPQDIQNMRSRAMSPLRASYAAAARNIGRGTALGGGIASPGSQVMQGRLAREQGQSMADVARATEADIAEQRQRGRLAGIGGMVSGYGATPGQAALYGSQALQGMGQQLGLNQDQNQYMTQLLDAQTKQATMPGKMQTAFNNVLAGAQVAGQLAFPAMNALPIAKKLLSSTPVGNKGFSGGGQGSYPGFAPTVPQNTPYWSATGK